MSKPYERYLLTGTAVLKAIVDRMGILETWDLRIGDIYLHPACVDLVKNAPDFDRTADLFVRQAFPGLEGYLFGMRVFSSDIVPEEHIAMIPDGIEGRLVSSAACIPLGGATPGPGVRV